MVVDGVELLRMIRDGEIKKDTKIKDLNKDKIYKKHDYDFIVTDNMDFLSSDYTIVELANTNFEILSEEEEEIDIDSIEEINFYTVNSLINGKFEENIDNEFKKHNLKINELIKAVKQLNSKIKGE